MQNPIKFIVLLIMVFLVNTDEVLNYLVHKVNENEKFERERRKVSCSESSGCRSGTWAAETVLALWSQGVQTRHSDVLQFVFNFNIRRRDLKNEKIFSDVR